MYFYNLESLEKFAKDKIRVWLLSVNLTDPASMKPYDVAEEKILTEFDINNKKIRQLKYIAYNNKNSVINEYTSEDSRWDYITPDSIYDSMIKYFKEN